MMEGLTIHESDALRLLARIRRIRHSHCIVVRSPVPGEKYLWSDPATNRTGTCCYGPVAWLVSPQGSAPVLFERVERRRDAADIRADLERLELIGLAESLCARHGAPLADVLGYCRQRPLPEVRAKLWGAVRGVRGVSLLAMGRLFGLDPTTIFTQIRKYCPEVKAIGKGRTGVVVIPDGVAA